MENPRRYGVPPYTVAVIHGGPGAPGTMAPVARELAREWGVLEPLQTTDSLEGQIEELRAVLEREAALPVALVGASWGAMLSFMLAGRYPDLVRTLILVGSGVFEAHYAERITPTRMSRLSPAERVEIEHVLARLDDPHAAGRDAALARMGELFGKTDAYDLIPHENEGLPPQYDIHMRVWSDAEAYRRSGEMLALGRNIRCPVVAIHGDYDPHPAEGIQKPLAGVLRDFRFVLLPHCGHEPWLERQAREPFYRVLREALRDAGA